MTNLEYYKDDIKESLLANDLKCAICLVMNRKCEKCIEDERSCIDWLLEEHKEPIKLKQWEKDLLETYDPKYIFYNHFSLDKMKIRGYFKGITDTNMTIQEILGNCEVEDR